MAKTKVITKTPDEIAREQVAAEEASRREARIAEIVAEEEARQEAERAEREAEEARKKAAAEAGALVEQRKPLEDSIAAKIAEIASEVEELANLHDRHRKALRESLNPEYTKPVGVGGIQGAVPKPHWAQPAGAKDVRDVVRSYLEGSLPTLYRKARAPEATLSETDPMTPMDSEDDAGRPVGDYPHEEYEKALAEREEREVAERERRRAADAARRLEDLRQRHRRARREYGRPVGFNELVMPEERTTLHALCTEEEIEQFRAEIEGHGDRRADISSGMESGGPDAA